jgi:hypothetical protein
VRVVLGLCAALLIGTAAQSAVFSNSNLGFSVDFSGEPEVQTGEVELAGGIAETLTLSVAVGEDDFYAVKITELGDSLEGVDPKTVLTRITDGAISDVQGVKVSETWATLDGFPAREVVASATFEGARMRMRTLTALKGGTLYQVLAVDGGTPNEAEAAAFVRSFHLLP